jgi:hypothetical protein
VKFFAIILANFGIALFECADPPLCTCNGRYESPPQAMGSEASNVGKKETDTFLDVDENMKENKIRALKAVALRECLIWGIITIFSLVTLVVASLNKLDEYRKLDYIMFVGIMIMCIVGPFGCFLCTRRAGKFVDIFTKVSEDDAEANNNAPTKPLATPKKTVMDWKRCNDNKKRNICHNSKT